MDEFKPTRKMKSLLSQGAEANRSGEYGQYGLEAAFRAAKIPIVKDNSSYHEAQIVARREKILIKQPLIELPYRNMKGDYLYKDFLHNLSVLFEVRSQLGGGTTDEKLFSALKTLAESPYPLCCLVLFGKGFRMWVRKKVYRDAAELSCGNKQIHVIDGIESVLYRKIMHLVEYGDFPR